MDSPDALFTEKDVQETRGEAAFWAADPSGQGQILAAYYNDLSVRIAAALRQGDSQGPRIMPLP